MISIVKCKYIIFVFSLSYLHQPISKVIDSDEEVKKSRTLIDGGVEKAAKQLEEYTKRWNE